jgi:FemAB-related protein (PEP-CTERM system-associated)
MDFRWLKTGEYGVIWDQALERFPEACFSFLYGWRQVYQRAFKMKACYLLAEDQGQVQGLCPLVFMKSPLIGRGNYFISLPYMTRAGILAADPAGRDFLLRRVLEKAHELKADFVELRELDTQGPGGKASNQEHVQMILDLPEDWNHFEKQVSPRLRQVKRAVNSGLTVKKGRDESLLVDFYEIFSRRMRELFFPVYPKAFFKEILLVFKDRVHLLVVYGGEKPLGGMLVFRFGDTISFPYVASLVQHQSLFPNQLLYHSAIRMAWEEGFKWVDFCRSQVYSGTYSFKTQWKARPQALAYRYPLYKSGDQLPSIHGARGSWPYRLAEKVWPRLPLPVTQWVGGRLIKQLVLA